MFSIKKEIIFEFELCLDKKGAEMNGSTIALITILVSICWYIFQKVKKIYAFFEERGIPYVPAKFPFGSDFKGATFMHHYTISHEIIYKKLKKYKAGGFFQYLKPIYLITDPEYVQKIFSNGFSSFYDRGFKADIKLNPLDENLFFLEGEKWRFFRQKLNPIFTSGKLRGMYEDMYKCCDTFLKHFERYDGKEINIIDDFGCLTTDIIGSTAFGIEINSIKNPNSQFRTAGKRIFDLSFYEIFKFFARFSCPDILSMLKMKTFHDSVTNFFTSAMQETLRIRQKSGIIRKDVVQSLLQLKENGFVSVAAQDRKELEQDTENSKHFEITDSTLIAQSFIFFAAGYETTANALNFCIYLLSKYPKCQEKAREEVRKMKAKYTKIEYDGLKELPYLEMCINESLRIYNPLPMIFRECNKDFTFPNGIKIEKGSLVIIPMHSLHNDPEYFKNPDVFNPERFNEPPKPGTFMPFGDGPRICIGIRFAMIEMKMILAGILDAFSLEKSELTKEPVKYIPTGFLGSPKDQLYVKVRKL